MNSSLLPPKWWYKLPTLDPARSTTSAMLASANPCPVNTARAASSSARCVSAVLAHCQEPALPRGGRAAGATDLHPFSERDSRSLTGRGGPAQGRGPGPLDAARPYPALLTPPPPS